MFAFGEGRPTVTVSFAVQVTGKQTNSQIFNYANEVKSSPNFFLAVRCTVVDGIAFPSSFKFVSYASFADLTLRLER